MTKKLFKKVANFTTPTLHKSFEVVGFTITFSLAQDLGLWIPARGVYCLVALGRRVNTRIDAYMRANTWSLIILSLKISVTKFYPREGQ